MYWYESAGYTSWTLKLWVIGQKRVHFLFGHPFPQCNHNCDRWWFDWRIKKKQKKTVFIEVDIQIFLKFLLTNLPTVTLGWERPNRKLPIIMFINHRFDSVGPSVCVWSFIWASFHSVSNLTSKKQTVQPSLCRWFSAIQHRHNVV